MEVQAPVREGQAQGLVVQILVMEVAIAAGEAGWDHQVMVIPEVMIVEMTGMIHQEAFTVVPEAIGVAEAVKVAAGWEDLPAVMALHQTNILEEAADNHVVSRMIIILEEVAETEATEWVDLQAATGEAVAMKSGKNGRIPGKSCYV